MAITREQKEQQIGQLVNDLNESQLTVLADYKGLSVVEMQELRGLLKEHGDQLRVIKNTLIRLAVSKTANLALLDPRLFDGPTALAFGFGDEAVVTKTLAQFAKTHPALELRGAVSGDGQVLSADEVQRLAALPGRGQMLAQLVGAMAAPLTGFVRVVGGNLSGLINVFKALSEQKA